MEFEVDGECHELGDGRLDPLPHVRPHSWRNPDRRARAGDLARRPSLVSPRADRRRHRGQRPDRGRRGRGLGRAARATRATIAEEVVALRAAGHELVLTHGNGPQVGALALQQAAGRGAALPLDALTAMTQGQIGYLLETAIGAGRPARADRDAAHRVLVDPDDPAFAAPTKPVGPFYDGERGAALATSAAGRWPTTPAAAGAAWSPSPRPLEVLGAEHVRALLERGVVVIAGGGGGIPVDEDGSPGVRGRDRQGPLLGRAGARDRRRPAGAAAPACRGVAIDYGTRWERELARSRSPTPSARWPTASSRPAAWGRRSSRRRASSRPAAAAR